jgi:hypothetical protein
MAENREIEELTGLNTEELVSAIGTLKDEVLEMAQNVSERMELDRRMKQNPYAVLGIAAAAGFTLGGGLWPLMRPFLKGAAKGLMTPANLIALATAIGAVRAKGDHPTQPVGRA